VNLTYDFKHIYIEPPNDAKHEIDSAAKDLGKVSDCLDTISIITICIHVNKPNFFPQIAKFKRRKHVIRVRFEQTSSDMILRSS
jgi:hypothetical protein